MFTETFYIPAQVHVFFSAFILPALKWASIQFHLFPQIFLTAHLFIFYVVFSTTAIKINTYTHTQKRQTPKAFSFCSVCSKKENAQNCFPLRRGKRKRVFKTHSVTRPLKGSKNIFSSPLEDQLETKSLTARWSQRIRQVTSSGVSLLVFPSLWVATINLQTHLFKIFPFWRA